MSNWLSLISFLACILLIVLGFNRGFDISDEGLYVLLADPLQENVAGIFNYDLFFKILHRLFGITLSLVDLRLLRLVLYLAGAWALTGFLENVTDRKEDKLLVFGVFSLGIFSGYGFLPPTLSYNSLVVVLACFWLNLLSNPGFHWKKLVLLGVLLSLFGYVKISLLPLIFLLTLFALWTSRGFRFGNLVYLFFPLIFLELMFWAILGDSAFSRLIEGVSIHSQRPGYQIKALIKSVLVGGFWTFLTFSLFFCSGFFWNQKKPIRMGVFLLSVLGFLEIGLLTHINEEWNHLVLLFSAAALGFFIGKERLRFDRSKSWAILLIFLPFILHFGSNVYWLRIGIHYWVFWNFAFILLIPTHRIKLTYFIVPISILLVFNGIWWHPFEQDKPLWKEKVAFERLGNEVIYLDLKHMDWARKVKTLGQERGTGELLAAYRIPGLVWLAGYQIPFSPGFWDKGQLDAFFEKKPNEMIYSDLEDLPSDWSFKHSADLGRFQGNSLRILWD